MPSEVDPEFRTMTSDGKACFDRCEWVVQITYPLDLSDPRRLSHAQLRLQMKPASYLELEAIALSAFREIKAFAAQPRPGDPL